MRRQIALGAALLVAGQSSWAVADTVLMEFATPYTSSIVPESGGGGPPYMTALFEDIAGQPGKVRLTLSTMGLTAPSEFVTNWYFNLDPTMDVSKLSFAFDAAETTAVTSENFGFTTDENDLDLGGQAVGFDFGTIFGTDNHDPRRFDADELFVGTLSSTEAGLNARSFFYTNAGDGKNDILFYGIAKVQGIGPNDLSTKLGATATVVPLPAAAWGGMALLGLLGVKQLRRGGTPD